MIEIKCDVHTHTLYSRHAFSTIEENVRAASEQGLELLATTDHYSPMLYPDYKNLRNYQYLCVSHLIPREWMGVSVLRGCEADIVDLDGHLFGYDIPIRNNIDDDPYPDGEKSLLERVIKPLDYVIASVHRMGFTKDAGRRQCTELYLKALEQPKVLILGHIGRTGLPLELDPILLRAKELHKLIEINEHSLCDEGEIPKRCREIAVRCAELSVPISTGTDAHISFRIGKFDMVRSMLSEIRFPEELIATRSRESFLENLRAAGLSAKGC